MEIRDRSLHLVKKALTLAVLVIDLQEDGPFKPTSDQEDMKALLGEMIRNDNEMVYYIRSARIILNGGPE